MFLCKHVGRAAAIAAAALVATPAIGAPPAPVPAPDPAVTAATLNVDAADVITLDVNAAIGESLQVVLPIEGVNHALDLWPHSIRAEGYQLFEQRDDGLLHEVDPGPVNTLRGTVMGLDGSIAAGGLAADGLYLTVILPDGRQYWLGPLLGRVRGAGKSQYALYRNGAAFPGGDCGTTDDQRLDGDGPAGVPGGSLRGITEWTALLATDADYEFYLAYGGTINVNNRIAIILNTMNLQYQRDVDIRHVVSRSIVRTSIFDPYTAFEEDVMNQQITAAWTGETGTWDLILVFTGTDRDLTGNVIGRANAIGSVCNGASSNCWAWADFNNNFSSATDLCAHELGHLWNGVHCPCSDPRSTMNPSITSVNRFGINNSDSADTSIPAYRNTRACLTSAGSSIAPPNDNCGGAIRIFEGTYAFNNLLTTTDGPAPSTCGSGNLIGNDIWYLYVAPCNGTLTVHTCVSGAEPAMDTVLAAYTGTCASPTLVACNDDSCAVRSQISFPVTAGTTYRIRVGGYDGDTGHGILTVDQTNCPAPSNNNCASALNIAANTDVPFSTYGATTDGPLEADRLPLTDDTVGNDVWFRWVASCTGAVTVGTCGSSFDTRIAVYNACPVIFNSAIACNDDACGLQSSVSFDAVSGEDYLIRVGGYSNAVGTGVLRIDACPPPPNDACANAIKVSAGGTFSGALLHATSDGSASCGSSANQPDVWYSFTAPAAGCGGTLTVTTCGTHDTGGIDAGTDTVISLHASCGGAEIACNDDAPNTCAGQDQNLQRDSRIVYAIAPGETVLIRVSKFTTSVAGPFTLNVDYVSVANSNCNSAAIIGLGQTPFCTLGATTDGPSEIACLFAADPQIASDVWFRYTAACSAPLRVSLCDSNYDTEVAVYAGPCPILGGSVLACNDDSCGLQSQVTFDAAAGVSYAIRVGGYNGAVGSGVMTLRLAADADEDGVVNSNDISAYLTAWLNSINAANRNADFNNDNQVNSNDISAFLSAWLAAVNNC